MKNQFARRKPANAAGEGGEHSPQAAHQDRDEQVEEEHVVKDQRIGQPQEKPGQQRQSEDRHDPGTDLPGARHGSLSPVPGPGDVGGTSLRRESHGRRWFRNCG